MLTSSGHLTYCTNIHAGESWPDHFRAIRDNFPVIKRNCSPDTPMGMGLRLSNEASEYLMAEAPLQEFREWLTQNGLYVFTMNGFPYGGFHRTRVKEQVHAPDWTTPERRSYTLRLFDILQQLLPQGMEGGVSTSPLGYRHLYNTPESAAAARRQATLHIIEVAQELSAIAYRTGKVLHLDIEPEPDGMMETGQEFIDWFEQDLLVMGRPFLAGNLSIDESQSEQILRDHIRLCYDVCHFAIGFEPHEQIITRCSEKGIRIGKIQISAALKASAKTAIAKEAVKEAFRAYDEPVYLHQVVARTGDGRLLRYPDMSFAIADFDQPGIEQWRAHFHVPVFLEDFGVLQSTQSEISEVLALQNQRKFTSHLEIETYTWEILPEPLKLPMQESITRELNWVIEELKKTDSKR